MAGIDDKVVVRTQKGGKDVEQVFEKWQCMSSKAGRKTFATTAYNKGMAIQQIMRFTGHKTESSFRKYAQLESNELTFSNLRNILNEF